MEQYLGLPPDGSAHGPEIDHLIGLVHWLMLILFVGWGAFYVYTLLRFRRSRQPKANYHGVKSHFSTYIEVGVLVAEVILLVVFSIPMWSRRVDAFPADKDAVVVRVVAEQFNWNIHYAGIDGKFGKTSITLINQDNPLGLDRTDPDAKDDIVTLGQLRLPVNKPAIIHLTTKDVIHSFSLPAYRVKQDAIPGMSIPIWFNPIKTTDEIREELRKPFSISNVMSLVQKIKLPKSQPISITKGGNYSEYLLIADCVDVSGTTVLSKGERLTDENVVKLTDAGVKEASVREFEKFDKYISADERKDNAGTVLMAKNEALLDEAVNKLIEAGIDEVNVRPVSTIDTYVSMETYNDPSGAPIVSKGELLSDDIVTKLGEANIKNIIIAPATPTEIACAQLCGLGHYRMRGYLTVQKPEDFQKWFDEEEASLASQSAPATTEETPADSTMQEIHN